MTTIALEQLTGDTRRLHEILNNEADLPCVVVAAAFLDSALAALLGTRLKDPSTARKLLAPDGPLGTFGARANLAYSLGLVTKDQHADLGLIGRIRNRFAHSHLGLSFFDPALQQLCEQLREWRPLLQVMGQERPEDPTAEQLRMAARNKFTLSVVLVANWLLIKALSEKAQVPESTPCA